MDNVTIREDNYGNITCIGLKKIKFSPAQLNTVKEAGVVAMPVVEESVVDEPTVVVENQTFEVPTMEKAVEEVAPVVEEQPVLEKEETPSFYSGSFQPNYDFADIEQRAKERVAKNYKEEPKIEPKKEEVKETKTVTVNQFKELLATKVNTFEAKEKLSKIEKAFTDRITSLNNLKTRQAKLADAFQTASNEEQMSKTNNELIEHRTKEMRNKDNFGYLEVSQNEDVRIVEIMERINKDLTDLLNMNLKVYNETKEKISKFANDKIVLEKESSKVREEIQNKTNELNGFMLKKVPDIRELIDGDKKISGVDDVDEEYDVVSNNTENLEDIKQTISANNTVDIPRVNPEVSQGPNAFVGLREDNAGKFKVINIDEYRNNVQEDTMSKVVGF